MIPHQPVKIIAKYRNNPNSFLGDPYWPEVSAVWSYRRGWFCDEYRLEKIRWILRKECFTAGRDLINRQIRYLRARSKCVYVSLYWFDSIFRDDFRCSLNNETPRWSFSYLDIYCTPYRLKSIVIFPVAKLQTLRFVGFINITSRCTYNLVTN